MRSFLPLLQKALGQTARERPLRLVLAVLVAQLWWQAFSMLGIWRGTGAADLAAWVVGTGPGQLIFGMACLLLTAALVAWRQAGLWEIGLLGLALLGEQWFQSQLGRVLIQDSG